MATSVVMPALEMAQETGKVLAWRKQEGERVVKGEPLLEIETDKAVVEIEALADGILGGVKAKVGDVVPVGQTIAWLLGAGEAVPAETAPSQSGRRTDSGPARSAAPAAAAAAPAPGGGARLSPKARRLAQEHGVDVATLVGSGPGGEILADDILAAAKSAKPAASASRGLSSIARLMAERTTASWTTVPHFFLTRDIDAGPLVAARDRMMAAADPARAKITHTDLLVALVARTLRRHPAQNSSWTGDTVRVNPDVNVGVAVAVEDGVVAVVVNKADTLRVPDIAASRQAVVERARTGKLQPQDLSGGTFTISNLGMFGVDAFTAIIVPPQAGILAVGAIVDRVVAVGGSPAVRPMMSVTLSCDHRVVDGARGAAFLKDLAEALADPDRALAT